MVHHTKSFLFIRRATALLAGSIITTGTAIAARDFSCSPKNNTCVVYDRSVVTGDHLGFFTERGELIATGKVTKMNGGTRSVQLQQVMGPVKTQAESYAMLDSSRSVSQETYKIYQPPTPLAVATHVGIATLAAGADAKGYEVSVEGLRRKFLGKVDGFVRGSVYSFTGSAENTAYDSAPGAFKSTSLATTGGVSYTLFSQNDVVLRTELGAGIAYTTAKINNSIDDAKSADWGYQVKSGFAPHIRGLVAAGYKFDGWQIEAGVAPAILAEKSATTIGAGLLINMK